MEVIIYFTQQLLSLMVFSDKLHYNTSSVFATWTNLLAHISINRLLFTLLCNANLLLNLKCSCLVIHLCLPTWKTWHCRDGKSSLKQNSFIVVQHQIKNYSWLSVSYEQTHLDSKCCLWFHLKTVWGTKQTAKIGEKSQMKALSCNRTLFFLCSSPIIHLQPSI